MYIGGYKSVFFIFEKSCCKTSEDNNLFLYEVFILGVCESERLNFLEISANEILSE